MNKNLYCLNCNKQLSLLQIKNKRIFCCKGCSVSYRQKAHDPDLFCMKNKDMLYYVLGLIFTDGNLDKTETKITLSLTQKDIIDAIYPYFCDITKRRIYQYQPKNCKNANIIYTIINTNKDTINTLKQMSLTSCNSTTKDFPDIPFEYMNSFLRGMFDGDGCVFTTHTYKSKKYKKVGFSCASLLFVNKFINFLKNLGFHPTVVLDSRRKNNAIKTYYIFLNRQKEIKQFYKYIYSDACIYMQYKRQRFE